jgi:hypothetical protein
MQRYDRLAVTANIERLDAALQSGRLDGWQETTVRLLLAESQWQLAKIDQQSALSYQPTPDVLFPRSP